MSSAPDITVDTVLKDIRKKAENAIWKLVLEHSYDEPESIEAFFNDNEALRNGVDRFCSQIEQQISAYKSKHGEPSTNDLTRLSERDVSARYREMEIMEYNEWIRYGLKEGDSFIFTGEETRRRKTFRAVRCTISESGQGVDLFRTPEKNLLFLDSWQSGPFNVVKDKKWWELFALSRPGASDEEFARSAQTYSLTVMTAPRIMLELKGVLAIVDPGFTTRAGPMPKDLTSRFGKMTAEQCAIALAILPGAA